MTDRKGLSAAGGLAGPLHRLTRGVIGALLIAHFAMAAAAAAAASPAPDRAYRPLTSGSLVQDKNFYLLTLLQQDPRLRQVIADDPRLRAAAVARRAALETAQQTCKGDIACELAPFQVSDDDAASQGDALLASLKAADLVAPLVDGHLRPSGRFQRYVALDDEALLRQAWIDAVAGINRIIRVYGLGEAPLYPLLDSIAYAQTDKMWKDAVGDLLDVSLDDPATAALFFDLPLSAALQLLAMNDRDEPARYEPLAAGENAAATAYAKTLTWSDWPYPVMLIPGRSPVLKDNPLSPEARQKMRLAARRFAQGLAPLIVVSGGNCFPSQTRYTEAVEMKRALMRDFKIPERAIVIDPFARHTTTNLRNTERLMFELGAPLDRPILVTTTDYQSRYIEAAAFGERCRRELGYECFSDLKRLSMFDTEVRLPLTALHRDARDPLDP